MDTSGQHNVAAQVSENLPSKTSRKVANHNEEKRTAFTISAADSMAVTDSGEQAVGMHSQNIEQAFGGELFLFVYQELENSGLQVQYLHGCDRFGHMRSSASGDLLLLRQR